MILEDLQKGIIEFEDKIFQKYLNKNPMDEIGEFENELIALDEYDEFMKGKKILLFMNSDSYIGLLEQSRNDFINGTEFYDDVEFDLTHFTFGKDTGTDCKIILNEKSERLNVQLSNIVCKLKRKKEFNIN